MPIRCFWELSRNINRITAQDDMRKLSISMYCQDSDAALKYRERLELEMGTVFEYKRTMEDIVATEKLERDKLHKLNGSQLRPK
mgnify:FL=1|nr:MAG TPA: hypothetical protein [Caudoviricetes sp.]